MRGYLSMLVNPNIGNLGIPLVFTLLGDQALIHAVIISTVVQLSHFTLGIWLLSGRVSLRAMFSNASIIALAVGLAWVATGWHTPAAVIRTVDLLAGMTLPVQPNRRIAAIFNSRQNRTRTVVIHDSTSEAHSWIHPHQAHSTTYCC